jgi:hypothetical protein
MVWMTGVPSGSTLNNHFNKPTTGELTFVDCSNTVINNLGQTSVVTHTLPAATHGLAFLAIISATGNAIHFKPASGGVIYLDGVALDANHKVSLATPAVANSALFFCFQTGTSSWVWYCNTIGGTWTDGAE